MKVRPSDEFLNNIRHAIDQTREKLEQIRLDRKSLMKNIRDTKSNIRSGEKHLSTLQSAKLSDVHEFFQKHINTLKQDLKNIRQQLLSFDIHREIEVCRYRILHKELDKLGVPFDPVAKKNKKKKTT